MDESINVKVVYCPDSPQEEIRRLSFPLSHASVSVLYNELVSRVRQACNLADNAALHLHYLDADNERVRFSTSDEFVQLVHQRYQRDGSSERPLKLYAVPAMSELDGDEHPGVRCDSCKQPVFGRRFKCMLCQNYDLCQRCVLKGSHDEHAMLVLHRPGDAESLPPWIGRVAAGHQSRGHSSWGPPMPPPPPYGGSPFGGAHFGRRFNLCKQMWQQQWQQQQQQQQQQYPHNPRYPTTPPPPPPPPPPHPTLHHPHHHHQQQQQQSPSPMQPYDEKFNRRIQQKMEKARRKMEAKMAAKMEAKMARSCKRMQKRWQQMGTAEEPINVDEEQQQQQQQQQSQTQSMACGDEKPHRRRHRRRHRKKGGRRPKDRKRRRSSSSSSSSSSTSSSSSSSSSSNDSSSASSNEAESSDAKAYKSLLKKFKRMGFKDDNGWLSELIKEKGGNLDAIFEAIRQRRDYQQQQQQPTVK